MKDIILIWVPAITGVWMIATALIMKTEDFSSSLTFKIIPFFLGLACLLATGVQVGWIHV